jgi:hypothetical protein
MTSGFAGGHLTWLSCKETFNRKAGVMKIQNFVVFFVTVVLAGCAAVPMTSSEFRESVKQDGRNIDSMTVNRSLGDVTRTFQKMSKDCLNFSIGTETRRRDLIGGSTHTDVWGLAKGTVVASPKHTELRFQRKIKDQVGTYPEDGMYFLVADVTPEGADKTNVKLYYRDSVKDAATAIKGWATGNMLGCPDPGRLF